MRLGLPTPPLPAPALRSSPPPPLCSLRPRPLCSLPLHCSEALSVISVMSLGLQCHFQMQSRLTRFLLDLHRLLFLQVFSSSMFLVCLSALEHR